MRCRSNLRGGGETMGLPRLEADPIWIGGLLDLPPDPRQRGIPYLDHPVKPDDDPGALSSC
ncbi:MAG: hypothetical protein GQ560_01655 [Dehalococcoidia bacterium]|nr:hypothetical protein [Dehalococcoidia bacterium]